MLRARCLCSPWPSRRLHARVGHEHTLNLAVRGVVRLKHRIGSKAEPVDLPCDEHPLGVHLEERPEVHAQGLQGLLLPLGRPCGARSARRCARHRRNTLLQQRPGTYLISGTSFAPPIGFGHGQEAWARGCGVEALPRLQPVHRIGGGPRPRQPRPRHYKSINPDAPTLGRLNKRRGPGSCRIAGRTHHHVTKLLHAGRLLLLQVLRQPLQHLSLLGTLHRVRVICRRGGRNQLLHFDGGLWWQAGGEVAQRLVQQAQHLNLRGRSLLCICLLHVFLAGLLGGMLDRRCPIHLGGLLRSLLLDASLPVLHGCLQKAMSLL
mmetsp:Transcript_44263/g.94326  ORF Transcript_44263/g.94326 Transcript_44263/m.94326 type:complete len:320 (-) Transcript_44263:558-1517(-)